MSKTSTPVAAVPIAKPHDLTYYSKCAFGGVLSCGLTHAATVSLDVHKCRAQAHSSTGKWPGSLPAGLSKLYAEEGLAGMRRGWVPTFFGYGSQGLFKFGLNEVFLDTYRGLAGGADAIDTKGKKMLLQACASGSAELFADVALCPFEMTKVRMQITMPVNGVAGFPQQLLPAFSAMSANPDSKFPFGSLKPLWGRQVPYTIIKFVVFYQTADAIYEYLESKGTSKKDMSEGAQLAITFGCGYWAGIFCAVATQPMDNLVSMAGAEANKGKSWGQLCSETGTKNLFTKGLGTRIIMVGTLTGLQWWIYGTFKNAMGFGTY